VPELSEIELSEIKLEKRVQDLIQAVDMIFLGQGSILQKPHIGSSRGLVMLSISEEMQEPSGEEEKVRGYPMAFAMLGAEKDRQESHLLA
jgi:hypothetical protein